MGDMSKEPSMEEILSSIKRIIAEEGEQAAQQPASRRGRAEPAAPVELGVPAPAVEPAVEEVLELTDEVEAEESMPASQPAATIAAEAARSDPAEGETILSVESEIAARHSLSALSSMLVTPADGGDNTLEGLVRAMLRPMLKEWLDARLPVLVEEMVAKEIARITAR